MLYATYAGVSLTSFHKVVMSFGVDVMTGGHLSKFCTCADTRAQGVSLP